MAKKKPIEPSTPSKAYLVSFGDTMTALLAFFIVLNSLAKEQTGANMYSGTGSFVNAFSSSGMPGGLPGKRSRDAIQQNAQKPVYALAKNMDTSQGKIGPDDTTKQDRIKDRDKEQFQKFLDDIEKSMGLRDHQPLTDQTVLDSFERWDRDTGAMSTHAVQLMSEAIAKLRNPDTNIEVIIWANMPSQKNLEQQLKKSISFRAQVEQMFWLKPTDKARIRYRVKPWLFADAKRPIVSVVLSKTDTSGI
ncbi:MAG: hypothetical protein HKN47_14690 [Pirellulaceae bacterium]|nr:hypothetical protein [Pirellulaceae bacterium]